MDEQKYRLRKSEVFIEIWVLLKMLAKPLNPMVLLIIIPFLNGYFIGNISYFQRNPYRNEFINGNTLSYIMIDDD